jgi:hypothetical protein
MNQDVNRQYVDVLFASVLHRAPRDNEMDHWLSTLSAGLDPRELPSKLMASKEFQRISERTGKHFVAPGHFYSPIVDVERVRARYGQQQPNVAPEAIRIDASAMLALWYDLLPFLKDIPFPNEADPSSRYYFHNPAFGLGDGSILHAMLRLFRPKRLVEVGSGYSSACSIETIDRYLDGDVDVSFVEPYPALLRKLLGEDRVARCTVHATGVQDTDMSVFKALEWGDILFIDSTHVMKTGSDVCHELFEVLPALKPGVLVHFHDIFWPFEYGSKWIIEDNRSWNEIYGLRAFLMYNEAFEIVFFNDWFARNRSDVIMSDYPVMLNNSGGSIWIRKVSG